MPPILRLVLVLAAMATRSVAHAAITATDLFTLGRPLDFIYAAPDGNRAASRGQIVGSATNSSMGGGTHAILWTAASPSGIDLHSEPYELGTALLGTDGTHQVGNGYTAGDTSHALLWNGTASSVIDFNPIGFDESLVCGVAGGQQVGAGTATSSNTHAML